MRPQRLRGVSYTGPRRYVVTCCTDTRLPWFTNTALVDAVWDVFSRQAASHTMAVHAYCFMPDHLHMLLEGRSPGADLCRFVATAKQRAAFVARRWVVGRMWQQGYHERVLRDHEPTLLVARYIVNNPVRAGLSRTPSEYPFLGSEVMSRDALIESVAW